MPVPTTTGHALPQFPRSPLTVLVPTLDEITHRLLGPGSSGLNLDDLIDACRVRIQRPDASPEIGRQYEYAADALETCQRLRATSERQRDVLDDRVRKELYVMSELYLVIASAYIQQAGDQRLGIFAAAGSDESDGSAGTG